MKVQKNTLLLIACIVWLIAGLNILRIGLLAYTEYLSIINYGLSLIVFAIFHVFIFNKLVKKHTARITSYTEKQFFLKFFDVKSFAIMAFMMTGGILLRASNIAPEQFIAIFYTGLGSALFSAGILFGYNFFKACFKQNKQIIK